ncbi:MAG: UvrD-helicase domain-containing protein, partial [Bacteroidota bacterium]
MTRFTLDQKKAHDPNRHISITANAGSGKTRVLVSRYCDIVEHFGAMPGDIAAITFTEKAASELRGKIAEEFERRLGSDQHRASWWLLKTAREKFPSAIVSTIHGFCSQLLREFPIETGVAPNYAVISGYERRRMSEDTLMEAIEHALADLKAGKFVLVA